MALSKIPNYLQDSLTSTQMPSGSVVQVVHVNTDAQSSVSSSSGVTALAATITPKFASSSILINIHGLFSTTIDTYGMTRLWRNIGGGGWTQIGQSTQSGTGGSNTWGWIPINHRDGDAQWEAELVSGQHLDSPNTISSIVYNLNFEVNYGTTITFNRPVESSNASYHWNGRSSITLTEIKA